MTRLSISAWFINKFKTQAEKSGIFQAASNMRKQGIPLEIALAILVHGVTQ